MNPFGSTKSETLTSAVYGENTFHTFFLKIFWVKFAQFFWFLVEVPVMIIGKRYFMRPFFKKISDATKPKCRLGSLDRCIELTLSLMHGYLFLNFRWGIVRWTVLIVSWNLFGIFLSWNVHFRSLGSNNASTTVRSKKLIILSKMPKPAMNVISQFSADKRVTFLKCRRKENRQSIYQEFKTGEEIFN